MLTAFEIGYRVGIKQAGILSSVGKGALRGALVGTGGGAAVGALQTPGEGESRFGNAMSAGAKGMAAGALLGGAHSGYKHSVNARMGPPKPGTPGVKPAAPNATPVGESSIPFDADLVGGAYDMQRSNALYKDILDYVKKKPTFMQ